jgi:chromosome segregation ATPase
MWPFKKKLSDEDRIKQNLDEEKQRRENARKSSKEDDFGDSKLGIELTKLSAKVEGLSEERKATNERFSKINEEIGELRGTLTDTSKTIANLETAATKAIDLVESVKPEKLMVEVRKVDSKAEALKANIESNESLVKNVLEQLKQVQNKIDFYKGVEQVTKLNDEIKEELVEIKKREATVERHSNKVESMFVEVEKKFSEFDQFNDVTKNLQRSFDKLQGDFDKLKVEVDKKADKNELVKFIKKFNKFEKHTTNLINLLDDKTKSTMEELKNKFSKLSKEIKEEVEESLKKVKEENKEE